MNQQKQLTFYCEDKYWNPALKKDFEDRVMGLWDKSYTGLNRLETQEKILREQITIDDKEPKKIEGK